MEKFSEEPSAADTTPRRKDVGIVGGTMQLAAFLTLIAGITWVTCADFRENMRKIFENEPGKKAPADLQRMKND